MDIGAKIKQTRQSLGLSQKQLAKVLWPEKDPKSAQSRISRYERGRLVVPATVYLQVTEMEAEQCQT